MVSCLARAALVAAMLGGCASLPPGADFPKTPSLALERPGETRLGRRFEVRLREHSGKSGFHLLPAGLDGFLARSQMVGAAERTLDVQYFIFQGDETGTLLTDAMLRAADRGVRVRVLLDDLEASGRAAQIAALDAHANIEIRLFNPFNYRGQAKLFRLLDFAFNSSRLDYRMHNKLFVVDNAIALVGGRNVGDEYFQVSSEFQFGDYDVFAVGSVVQQLSATFDAFWNGAFAIPVAALQRDTAPAPALQALRTVLDEYRRKLAQTDYVRKLASGEPLAGIVSGRVPLVWAQAQVVSDSPDKRSVAKGETSGTLLRRPVETAAAAVRSELLLVSPYFIPGDDGMQLFKELRRRQVRVRVLTNSLGSAEDSWPLMAHAAYARYRRPLLETGVELYEVRPVPGRPKGSGEPQDAKRARRFALHAKVFVFDRQRLFIGSMNFDQRSMRLNTEVGLIIDSPELAQQTAARFESIMRPANSYALALRSGDGDTQSRILWLTEERGKSVAYESELARGPMQQLKVDFFALLPLEGEL